MKKANHKHPKMGLNNEICTEPKYWCRLHEVWLSEKDVSNKRCRSKQSYDMIDVYECGCLEVKNFEDWLKGLVKNNAIQSRHKKRI